MTTLNKIPRINKHAISLILFVQILAFTIFIVPLNVSAYSRKENNLNPNYSLTGNGSSDIVAVARAQIGKKYPEFSGFHYRAWCADFVSACAAAANQSVAIPGNASVDGIRSSIKKAGGVEYSKSTIQNGKYVPKRGDIIIFKSSGYSHVGIVDHTSNSRIYYIDGNNTTQGNGNDARVHDSNITFTHQGFTSVISPNYKNQNPAPAPDTNNNVKGFRSCVEQLSINPEGLSAGGWAIYGSGISEVVAYLNGTPVCNCERFERTDVSKAFPGYPTGKEGFRCKISESVLRPGKNEIFFRSYTNSNTQVIADFGHRTINYTPKKGLVFQIEDLPKDLVAGQQTAGGWVLTDTTQKVIIIINGKAFQTERFTRNDVAKAFPGYPTGNEGFRLKIDPTQVVNGVNELIVRAYLSSTDYQDIYKGEFHATKMPEQLFDFSYYYGMYSSSDPTVKTIGRNAEKLYKDWCTRGLGKGYSPSVAFDPVYYLEANPDVRNAYGKGNYVAALHHWVDNVLNSREFRDCSPFLKLDYYRKSYSDLRNFSPAELVYHFVNWGACESRIASDTSQALALHKMFNAQAFAKSNPDLLKVYGEGRTNPKAYWQHLFLYSIAESEKRITNEGFDLGFVLDKYGFQNGAEALRWYLNTGYIGGYETEKNKETGTEENVSVGVGSSIEQLIVIDPILPETEEKPMEDRDEIGNKSPETERPSIENNAGKEDESTEEIEEPPIENRDETEEKLPETEKVSGNESQTEHPTNKDLDIPEKESEAKIDEEEKQELNNEEDKEDEAEKDDVTSDDQEKFPGNKDREEKEQEKGTCYKIVFRSNGKIVKTQKVEPGETIKEPDNITKRGYILLGWYSNGTRYCFDGEEVSSDLTLTAKWERVSVKKTIIKSITIKSITKKGKKLRITYSKITGVKGYEIQYSKNKTFKNAVKRKTSKLTYETTPLKRNGTYYYVRVRAYKFDSAGKQVFGKWSSKKKVKM